MITFITTAETLPLRNLVLREGRLSHVECVFPGDDDAGSFHLGYSQDNEIVCVATFHVSSGSYGSGEQMSGSGYQLRGMATHHAFQGMGIGNKLMKFAIQYLQGQKVNYIWCNARKNALRFYSGLGFVTVSEEFEIPGIGPHYKLHLKIQ